MRIKNTFDKLKQANKKALITYIMAFDNSLEQSEEVLNALPAAGVDIIELGLPFSDPMADGPVIEKAAIRALKAGAKMEEILKMVERFREINSETPIVLMGYFNPIHHYGIEKFCADAKNAGVDGLLIVDLPIEEDSELFEACKKNGLNNIKLITPTTGIDRIKLINKKAEGFLYYVAVAGVTGAKSASSASIKENVDKIKQLTNLPIAVGFGIKTPQDAKEVSKNCDAVVVGSSLVAKINDEGTSQAMKLVKEISDFISR